jgi:hypothetical protein
MKVQLIRLALAIVLMAFGVWGAIVLDGGLQVLSGFWAFFMISCQENRQPCAGG